MGNAGIRFVDLQRQTKIYAKEIHAAIAGVVESCGFILGKEVAEFERGFAGLCGTKHAVGVGSGLDALRMALTVLGVGPGDEVVTVANTFVATALAVSSVGAKPVLVDMDEKTFNLDPGKIEGAITKRTKAIMPVHLYGQPAAMDEITAIAKKHKLRVIEDACQAHGAQYRGKPTGGLSDIACFSFYPGKNLGGFGDAGMLVTNDDGYAEAVRMLRNYGQEKKYYHKVKGGNSRLDTIQAAVLNVKLKHLGEFNRARNGHARRYNELLAGVPNVEPPFIPEDSFHVFHLYVIRTTRRDELLESLGEKGISCGIHYPIPIHRLDAYRDLGHAEGAFPATDKAAKEILSLPMFPELAKEEIETVAGAIASFHGR